MFICRGYGRVAQLWIIYLSYLIMTWKYWDILEDEKNKTPLVFEYGNVQLYLQLASLA